MGCVREQHPSERQDVFVAVAERRNVQLYNLEPIVEVLSKAAVFDLGGKIAVGGRQNTNIHRPALVLPDPTNLPLLKHPQELDLHT
jgi:hypothetical protein